MGCGARGVTRYDGTQQAELGRLDAGLSGPALSPHRQDFTALIGQAGEQVQGIYEADYRNFNRETYVRGRETFDATYAGFKSLLARGLARGMKKQRPPLEGKS